MTMKEMAAEYRLAAAKIRMQIKRMEKEGAPPGEINQYRYILTELRDTANLLSAYYDAPRVSRNAAVNWWAPRVRRDK